MDFTNFFINVFFNIKNVIYYISSLKLCNFSPSFFLYRTNDKKFSFVHFGSCEHWWGCTPVWLLLYSHFVVHPTDNQSLHNQNLQFINDQVNPTWQKMGYRAFKYFSNSKYLWLQDFDSLFDYSMTGWKPTVLIAC